MSVTSTRTAICSWSRDVEFVDELPLTPVAKVDKKLLRERYRSAHATDRT
jgi:acyl-CoA synthetase (AMP-forming)/AMP-acid ligase II